MCGAEHVCMNHASAPHICGVRTGRVKTRAHTTQVTAMVTAQTAACGHVFVLCCSVKAETVRGEW